MRIYYLKLVLFCTVLLGTGALLGHRAYAASFDPTHIIDDLVFNNSNSMSAQDIQNFLNSKAPTCDTTGSQSITYLYNSSNGAVGSNSGGSWVTTSRATYGQRYDSYHNTTIGAAPYVCLNQYIENPTTHQNNLQNPGLGISGGESAAQIIYNAAQQYGINPQVIIVTLQKEQGLVTDDWPFVNEYQAAMGYNCPDTGSGCNSANAGFYTQVNDAAWQFRQYATYPNNYNFIPGTNYVQYDVSPSCGGTTLNIQNQATASLYDYTPYQPNAAALSGSGDGCSTYGNMNFFNYFTSWFGTTYNPFYAWQVVSQQAYYDSSRTLAIGTDSVAPNQVMYMRITARNMGNLTWTNSGANPVDLGTSQPQNRTSAFCDNTWLSCNRPARLLESSVASGQTGTFEFEMKAPNAYGTYNEHFTPVAEGSTWMNDVGMYWQFGVKPPTYSWQYEGQGTFADYGRTQPVNNAILAPNTSYYLTVSAQNTGNTTWTNSGANPVDLGTSQPQDRASASCDNTWLSCNRPARLLDNSVTPGQTGTFEFRITTPNAYGTYNEHFTPVAEGSTWMNDAGLYWPLNVRSPIALWQYQGQAAYTDSTKSTPLDLTQVANNTRFYVTVSAQNTGNTTWTNSGANPVDLGTSQPQDRASAFCDSTWLNCSRPARLDQASVAPGQVGTFSFWMHAPYEVNSTTLRDYFTPVVEGSMWMNDLGLYWPVTFQTPITAWQYMGQGTFSDSGYSVWVDPAHTSINTAYYLQLSAKNTGGTTWVNSGSTPLNLGTSNPYNRTSIFSNNTWLSSNRPTGMKEASVAPGQTGTFQFKVTTPSTPGTYNEYFNPVIDGTSWLTDLGVYWGFTIN